MRIRLTLHPILSALVCFALSNAQTERAEAQIEACCSPYGTCLLTDPVTCTEVQGGDFVGGACVLNRCRGGCCRPNGTCSLNIPKISCEFNGGTYLGHGSNCTGADCPVLDNGACCFEFNCQVGFTPEACTGYYPGNDSTCLDCPGACCLADDSCIQSTRGECEATEGASFPGNLTDCPPDGCGEGACCLVTTDPAGLCSGPIDLFNCEYSGGVYQGNGTDCGTTTCAPFGGGCCCGLRSCFEETQQNCESYGCLFLGEGISCGADPTSCGGQGACCPADGSSCLITDGGACISAGGSFRGENSVCDPNPCPPSGGECGNGTCDATEECTSCPSDCPCPPALPYCVQGACVECTSDAHCDDGDACDGLERCFSNLCLSGEAPNCDDSNVCTTDGCVPATGCSHAPISCDDGNLCTLEACDAHEGCMPTGYACGACCDKDHVSYCFDSLPGSCQSPSQQFRGLGSMCATLDPPCAGACCIGEAGCVDNRTPPECAASAGTFMGMGTTCDSAPCGACCVLNLGCLDGVVADACPTATGEFFQNGHCNSIPCGACCDPENLACTEGTLETECTGLGHVFRGNGSSCGTILDPCPGVCANDTQCQDNDACNGQERCIDNACVPGDAPDCDDQNSCTEDSCDPATGCKHEPVDCNDNDACTTDSCDPATGCKHEPVDCNDNDTCTADTCDAATGCVYEPVDCNDNDACTTDTCESDSGCKHTPRECDDLDPCTADTCDSSTGDCVYTNICGACCYAEVVSTEYIPICDDGLTQAECDAIPGVFRMGKFCNDEDTCWGGCCNNGDCHIEQVAVCALVFGTYRGDGSECCSDFDACNGLETCDSEGQCHPGTPPDCNDDIDCTRDECSSFTGCYHVAENSRCTDSNPCTTNERCDPDQGGCVSDPVDCDDGIDCTDDSCNAATGGCEHAPNHAACFDESACTTDERCDPVYGGCRFDPINCDDGFACTDDACDPTTGCQNAANTSKCDDINACTNDACDPSHPEHDAEGCVHAVKECNDNVACTEDSCNPITGECTHTPNNDRCLDEDGCTVNERCDALEDCVWDSKDCADTHDCTVDRCQSPTGECIHAPDDGQCNDNKSCTNDTCDATVGCLFGADDSKCNDNVSCTVDDCVGSAPGAGEDGCVHTPDDELCIDGDPCTVNERCDPTSDCVSDPTNCSDANACTEDSCDPHEGCQHEPICGACCRVGEPCRENQTPEECSGAFDTFMGPTSTCATAPCGACCEEESGACTDGITEIECTGAGKLFQGPNSRCAEGTCHGACCVPDPIVGECVPFLTAEECAEYDEDAIFMGVGSTCDTAPCGACCNPSGTSCIDAATIEFCDFLDYEYQGDQSKCDDDPCKGACCHDNAPCEITGPDDCTGTFHGVGSTCPDACQGACCHPDGTCSVGAIQDCPGDYRGDRTDCAELNPPCEPFEGGACCLEDGACVDNVTEDTCFIRGGAFQGQTIRCENIDCGKTGACCFEPSGCEDLTEKGCAARGGAFGAVGSACDDEPDPCAGGKGACCKPDGTCAYTTRAGCAGRGVFRGENTSCDELNPECQPFVPGACCFSQGGCLDNTDQAECILLGGVYQSNGTTCADEDTKCEGLGACCDVAGGCRETTQEECEQSGGTFLGVDSICDGYPGSLTCPASGACCRPAGTCYIATKDSCLGAYRGDGTDCIELNPPCEPFAAGACCFDPGECYEASTASQCYLAGGLYQGDNSTCDDSNVNDCLALGACCITVGSETSCEQTTEPGCTALDPFLEGVYGVEVTTVFLGVNVPCAGVNGDECPTTGACCRTEIGCSDGETEALCTSLFGNFLGLGTKCASSPCGACCDAFSSACGDGYLQSECASVSGVFQGPNSTCAASECNGACCLADETCIVIEGESCNGDFRGTDTNCAELNPPCTFFLAGACCLSDEECRDGIERDTCVNSLGGDYQGDATLCAAVDCAASGACCFENGDCAQSTEAGCEQHGAVTGQDTVFLGVGSECAVDLFGTPYCPDTGACCQGDPLDCAQATAVECALNGGAFLGLGIPCREGICHCPGGCDDGFNCTFDDCNTATGTCIHVPSNALCDDRVDCTVDECFTDSGCKNTPDDAACDDNDPCTVDSCDATGACSHTPIECDDGIDCTADLCDSSGNCQYTPSSAVCNDGVACTEDICDPARGCISAPNDANCEDGDLCTINTCDPVAGCKTTNVSCPFDLNVCTDDLCDPATGLCTHAPVPGRPCNDVNRCTTNDACNAAGACVGGPPPNCDDGDPCTNDGCEPGPGCTHTPACDDGDPCTQDICLLPLAGCANPPILCPDDGDPCTAEVCINPAGCTPVPRDCNDGNPCTDDSCGAGGCINTPNSNPCDDGDFCTTVDRCAGGACTGGPPPDCTDGDLCTVDDCDPATGCHNDPAECPRDQRCDPDNGECVCPELCGDLDFDDDVDIRDYLRFLFTFGRRVGDPLFNVCADYDGDGVITFADFQAWRRCAKAFLTRGAKRR